MSKPKNLFKMDGRRNKFWDLRLKDDIASPDSLALIASPVAWTVHVTFSLTFNIHNTDSICSKNDIESPRKPLERLVTMHFPGILSSCSGMCKLRGGQS